MSEEAIILSVVIPVYNAEKTLRETLDSVLNQSLKAIEVICVDDGSTDASVAIIREIMARDSRVSLLQQQNRYAGIARNRGIEAARGEYLFFLDADDYVLDYALEAACDKARKHRLDFLKFLSLTYDEQENRYADKKRNSGGYLKPGDDNRLLTLQENSPLLWVSVTPWSGIYRRDFLMETGCRFNGLRCVNDRSFYSRIMTRAERMMISLDRVTVHRENQASSLVGKRSSHFDCQIESIRLTERQLAEDGIAPDKAALIMNQEYQDLIFWYRRFSADPEREAEMKRQIDAYLSEGSPYRYLLEHWVKEAAWFVQGVSPAAEVRPFHERCGHPKVTVLVPVGDDGDTLNRALDSLTNQTMEEMEFLLLDDGATGEARTIMREYELLDKRFIIDERPAENRGQLLNRGLETARGSYVGILAPTDRAERDLYARLYAEAAKHRAEIMMPEAAGLLTRADGQPDSRKEELPMAIRRGRTARPKTLPADFPAGALETAGLYHLPFLKQHGIRFPEGPEGESFCGQALRHARRIRFLAEAVNPLMEKRAYWIATWAPRKIRTGTKLIREHGAGFVTRYGMEKARALFGKGKD